MVVAFTHVFVKPPKKIAVNGFFEVDGNALSWHVAGFDSMRLLMELMEDIQLTSW